MRSVLDPQTMRSAEKVLRADHALGPRSGRRFGHDQCGNRLLYMILDHRWLK
jgi:hypothetical protein